LYDYQKQRIQTFLDPLSDIQGAGYNAYQSTVAVGSGELFGKGIGYGTQSKLFFLPEFQTDFIFAAYAEEWGFIGVVILFSLFSVVVWRLVEHAVAGASNFEKLFTVGVALMLMSHFFVHIGMNVGLLPVTGLTVPFLSYGGSHLVTSAVALGMVMAMRRYAPVRVLTDDALVSAP
jgi:rod shape determining protein RodA